MTFDTLGLNRPILNALAASGYEKPTPIQAQAIPPILEGHDVVGLAQTGTGKTAAFTLPLLQRLSDAGRASRRGNVRVLILAPTRELALQINKAVRDYGRRLSLTSTCVVGGMSIRPQRQALAAGVDILVATPGRLLDLVEQRAVRLDTVETLVLDEADQMLDIGFMPAIKRVLAMVPPDRQMLMFSATMPKEIRDLAARYMRDPVEVSVAKPAATAERIDESVMHMTQDGKIAAVTDLIRAHAGQRVLVFTRTKRGADRVARRLAGDGLGAAAIHGNKSQGQRQRALDAFRKGSCPVLIATDVAARGIDVPDVGLVVNFELPNVPEVYIHRIGRTARAGASGVAISLCAGDERPYLRDIERLIRREIRIVGPAPVNGPMARPQQRQSQRQSQGPSRRNGPPRSYRASSAGPRAA